MFRFLLTLVFLSFALAAAPVEAQVNFDIPETEGPGGDGPGGGNDPFFCEQCDSRMIWDPTCCEVCGSQCGLLPSCPSYKSMLSIEIPPNVNIAIHRSMSVAIEQLSSTKRGKVLASILNDNVKRVGEIYVKNPELTNRAALALVRYWPHDMWINTGEKAHLVTAEAMQELHVILTEFAKADEEMGGAAVGDTIRNDVLPHLTKDLIGKPYHRAFACFIGSQSCS